MTSIFFPRRYEGLGGHKTHGIPGQRSEGWQPEETSDLVRSWGAMRRVNELRSAARELRDLQAANSAQIVDLMHGSAAERIQALRELHAAQRAVAELHAAEAEAALAYRFVGELVVPER